jgi:4-hydroxy-tetrahydrodipicolinate reductase
MMMLGVGQPSPSILTEANKFISAPINNTNTQVLQYGLKQGFSSYRNLVKNLLCELTSDLNEPNPQTINENNIYMTNGISQAVFMLASLFRSRYDTIFVEELTYFIMINVFKDLNYNIKTFKITDIKSLCEDLKQFPSGALIYLIPYCNNPTGKSVYIDDVIQLAHFLPKNCICLSDETYQFLQNDDTRFNKSLALFGDNIISLGTFSKILVPGVRLGWIYTNLTYSFKNLCEYLNDTGFMDSGGSVNPVMAYMITNNITHNFKSYLEFLKNIKAGLLIKEGIITKTLRNYPEYFQYEHPDGGYFIFVKSLKLGSTHLLELANQCGLSFHIGNKFAPRKNYHDWFRLSVSYYSVDDFNKYFEHRIQNLVKLIDLETENEIDVSVFGFGKLGKLIDENLTKNKIVHNVLTRNFENEIIGDIIIDVSSPNGSVNLINFLIENNLQKKIIIGTTGHIQEQIQIIKKYSKKNPIVLCPNFSSGIQNLIKIIRNLDKVWNKAHISDIHHTHKKDSPSGTALLLKKELEKRDIKTEIESTREGEVIGTHIITISGDNENLILSHVAENRDIFATGCINLIEKIKTKGNGLYDFI